MYYDFRSKFNKNLNTPFVYISGTESSKVIPALYKNMVISPTCDAVAVVDSNAGEIYLLAIDGLHLFTVEGNNALFSYDGDYLFIISQNSISKFPVSAIEIRKLLMKYNITGSTEADKGLKMVI